LDLTKPEAFDIEDLMNHEFPPSFYWWGPKLLPHSGGMMIAAPTGIGKSLVSLSIIRGLTLGQPIFGWSFFDVPESCRVLYMDQEVSPGELKERVGKIFTPDELQKVFSKKLFKAMSSHPEVSFSSEQGIDHIIRNVEKHRPNVLILDPISLMHDGKGNDNDDIVKLMRQIGRIKSAGVDWGLSVIIIHHIRKPPSDKKDYDPLDHNNILGASQFSIQMDSILMLEKKSYIGADKKAWQIKARFSKVRNESHFEDFLLHVNENRDLRAEFKKTLGGADPTPFPKMNGPNPGDSDSGPKAGDLPTGPLHCVTR
jgi:RecA-family ATPase